VAVCFLVLKSEECKMRRLYQLKLFVLIFFLLVINGCGNSGKINMTTQDFFLAVNKGEYEKAKLFVTTPGSYCITCHNEVMGFKQILPPEQLEQAYVDNLMVKGKVATGYLEFTTTRGKIFKTAERVTFIQDSKGLWKINYTQIRTPSRWSERDQILLRNSDYVDDGKTFSASQPTAKTQFELPEPGFTTPITEHPIKFNESDTPHNGFWSNSVKTESSQITFSPAYISFKPDNEDPAVFESSGKITVKGWLVNSSERKVTNLSNIRLTLVLNSRQIGRLVIDKESMDLSPGMMQFKEYTVISDSVATNMDFNKVILKVDFSVN
jgi:hypothetical protein